jgi:O-antigen/teichoic acid export membrane protein
MLRKIGLNFFAQFTSLLLAFADRFLVVGILIKSWGAGVYANWAVLVSAAGLVALGEFGLNIYYGNVWQKADALGDDQHFQRMVRVALGVALPLGLGLLAILALAVSLTDVRRHLSITHLTTADCTFILVMLGLAAISTIMRGSISQIYRGRRQFAVGTMITQGSAVCAILSALLVAGTSAPPTLLAALYLTSELLAGWGLLLFDLKRRFTDLVFRPALPTRVEFLDIIHHVKWLAIPQVGPIAWLQLPVLLLGFFAIEGKEIVAFILARTLVNFSRQISSMISNSLGTELAHAAHAGSLSDVENWLTIFSKVLSAGAAAMMVAIMFFGAPFFAVWTGDPSLFHSQIIFWLLAGMLLATPAMALSSVFLLTNAPQPVAIAMLTQLAAAFALMPITIPQWGAAGAAAALAFSDVLANCIVLPLFARRHLDIGYLQHFSRCLMSMLLAALISGSVAFALTRIATPSTAASLVIMGTAWGLLGFLPAIYVALPLPQRQRLANILTTATRRILGPILK